jgi:hypothetical protein
LRKPVIGRQQIWRDEAKNLAMIFYSERLFLLTSAFLFLEKEKVTLILTLIPGQARNDEKK